MKNQGKPMKTQGKLMENVGKASHFMTVDKAVGGLQHGHDLMGQEGSTMALQPVVAVLRELKPYRKRRRGVENHSFRGKID